MKPRNLIITLLILSLSGLTACKKYPDGPGLTMRSKKDRLANEWVIHKINTNGVDVTQYWVTAYPDFLWTIKKDFVYDKLMNGVTTSGTWALNEDKEEIIFQETGSPTPEIYTIYRLKHAELWLYRVVGGDETEYHFIPKEE